MGFFDFDEQTAKESPFINKLTKAKYLSMREKFAEAKKIYEEILEKDYAEPNALAGLLRVDSHNFENYFGEEIEKDIKFLKKVIYKLDDDEVNEYLDKYEEYQDLMNIHAVKNLELEKNLRKFEAKKAWEEYISAYAKIYCKTKFAKYDVSIENELAIIKKYADYNYLTSRIYLAMAYFTIGEYDTFNELMQEEMNNNPSEAFPAYFLLVFLNQEMFPNIDIEEMYELLINNQDYMESAFGKFVVALMHSNYPGAIRDFSPSIVIGNSGDIRVKKSTEYLYLKYLEYSDFEKNTNQPNVVYLLETCKEKSFLLLYTYLKKQQDLGKL